MRTYNGSYNTVFCDASNVEVYNLWVGSLKHLIEKPFADEESLKMFTSLKRCTLGMVSKHAAVVRTSI